MTENELPPRRGRTKQGSGGGRARRKAEGETGQRRATDATPLFLFFLLLVGSERGAHSAASCFHKQGMDRAAARYPDGGHPDVRGRAFRSAAPLRASNRPSAFAGPQQQRPLNGPLILHPTAPGPAAAVPGLPFAACLFSKVALAPQCRRCHASSMRPNNRHLLRFPRIIRGIRALFFPFVLHGF